MRHPVVIVGGGIFGVSVLDALARRGILATLLEQGELGSGATGHSGGMLRRWHASSAMVELACESMPFWNDVGYNLTGSLYFELPDAPRPNLPEGCEWLTGDEGAERFPQFAWQPEDRAIYERDGGFATAREAVQIIARRAVDRGARVSTGTRVMGLLRHGDRAVGVVTTEGEVRASTVIWATGPFGTEVELPESENRFIQVIALEGPAGPQPCWLERRSRGFLRSVGNRVWIGVGLEARASSPTPTALDAGDAEAARTAVAARYPAALDWPQVDGVRTADRYMPDRLPRFGPAHVPGLFWALGGSGAGFKVAPALAARFAEQLCRSV